jgi:hypothetical protein
VSAAPNTAAPSTRKPTTQKPTSAEPSPPPTPSPNSAAPTTQNPSPNPTPPPSEFDLAQVTWENIVSRRFAPYCPNADLLIKHEKTALRALCSWEADESSDIGGGWAVLESFETCEAYQNELMLNYFSDLNMIPTTTTEPFFTTTTTAEQILYNPVAEDSEDQEASSDNNDIATTAGAGSTDTTEGNYEHPYTTRRVNYFPQLYEVLKCIHATIPENGWWMKRNICNEVNSLGPLGRMAIATRDEFFAEMKSEANICPRTWYLDLYENMSTERTNTETIHDTNALGLYDKEHGVYGGVIALCDDHEAGGRTRQHWVEEYGSIQKDEEWYQSKLHQKAHFHDRALELPSPQTNAGDNERDYQLIFKFESLTDYERNELCKTARSYDDSNSSSDDWWMSSVQHHHDDLTFWLKKFGRSHSWNLAALRSVLNAPQDLLMAFAKDPSAAKSTCQGNIAYVTDATRVGGDIWNDLTMQHYKEYQMTTRYLMKQCWNNQHASERTSRRDLDGHADTHVDSDDHATLDAHDNVDPTCESVKSWKQETQVGIDLSLRDFHTVIVRCEHEVVGWLREQYNQQTDHRDAVQYYKTYISDKLGAGKPVMLKQWAYWVFDDVDQQYFPCFEWARADAQHEYIDTALKACESLHEVADDSLMQMEDALSGPAMDMTTFRDFVEKAYVNKFPDTTSGWVAIKTNDHGALESVPVPGMEVKLSFSTQFAESLRGSMDDPTAALTKALQDTLEIGVASEMLMDIGNEVTVIATWYDVTEDEIITKMGNIVKMVTHGSFALGENDVPVNHVAFPVQYAAAHTAYTKVSEGKSAAYVTNGCVINPLAAPEKQYLKGKGGEAGKSGSYQPLSFGALGEQVAPVESVEEEVAPEEHHEHSEAADTAEPAAEVSSNQEANSSAKFGILSLFTAALYMY